MPALHLKMRVADEVKIHTSTRGNISFHEKLLEVHLTFFRGIQEAISFQHRFRLSLQSKPYGRPPQFV